MRRCLVLIVPRLFVSAIADAARADDRDIGRRAHLRQSGHERHVRSDPERRPVKLPTAGRADVIGRRENHEGVMAELPAPYKGVIPWLDCPAIETA
jgi:hypothetical protein